MAAYCMRRFQKSSNSRCFPYWLWFIGQCKFSLNQQYVDPSASNPNVFVCFPLVPRGGHEGMQKIRSVIRAKLEACNNALAHCSWYYQTKIHISHERVNTAALAHQSSHPQKRKKGCSMQTPTEPWQAVGMLRADGKKRATRGPHAAKDIQLALRPNTKSLPSF